jgi:hypothetical protein
MKYKYTVSSVFALTFALAGVVWSQSGPSLYSLRVSPAGSTMCSSESLLSPPFYKCSNMKLIDVSGVQIGTADWGYTNGTLLLTLEQNGEVSNYAIPATRSLTSGAASSPGCNAEWIIQTKATDGPQVSIRLGEYKTGGSRVPEGCRASWNGGTITQ